MRQFGAGSPIAIKPESVAAWQARWHSGSAPLRVVVDSWPNFMSVSTVCILVHGFSWLWTAPPEIQNGFQV